MADRIGDNAISDLSEFNLEELRAIAEEMGEELKAYAMGIDVDELLKEINFDSVPQGEQPRLDKSSSEVTCPHCGGEFIS